MNTKSDWRTVNEQLMNDDRRKLEPPTAEEMLAYTRGELSPEDEQRVRERLVCYPDLVRTLTEPFPDEGAEPGDRDYIPDEEYASHWDALQPRLRRSKRSTQGRRLQFWRTSAALAAALAVALGLGWWLSLPGAASPRIVEQTESLMPDGRRGGSGTTGLVQKRGDSSLLVVPLINPRDYVEYRLELIRVKNNRTLWRSGVTRPRQDGPYAGFSVLIPNEIVDRGEYRIVVHGVAGKTERPVASYPVRFK
jgi:hypothetical protein